MASPKGIDEATEEASDLIFPAAEVDKELRPEENNNFEVDPISSEEATSLEIKQQAEAEQKKKEKRKEVLQTLKTTILVSAAIVAVAGVVCAVTKKLREK